jgi:mannosyltransferase
LVTTDRVRGSGAVVAIPTRVRDGAAVAIPTVLAAVLCCFQITDRSLGFDEAASVTIAAQHGSALWSAIAHDGGNMSGYYLLLHVVIAVFGDGVLAVRLLSIAATAGGVAAVCLFALRVFDRRVALAAGLIGAVSLPLVFWGQSARGYALMVAAVSASFVALAALVERSAGRRPARGPWLAYVAFTVVAVYAGFVAVLVIPAQLVALRLHRHAARLVGRALAVSAVCCVPLLVLAVSRGSGQLFWVPRPSLSGTLDVLYALASAGLRPSFKLTSTSGLLLGLTALVVGIVAVEIARRPEATERRWVGWAQVVLAWALVPLVLALLESFVGQSISLPRNLLMSLPAVALLLGLALADRRVPSVIGAVALAALLALRALQLAPSYGVSPEDWRTATAYVIDDSRPGDCLAFYPQDGRMAFAYYLARTPHAAAALPRPLLPPAPLDQVKTYVEDYATLSPQELSSLPSACARIWLVSSHEGQPNGPAGSRANLARSRALRAALEREYPQHSAVSFGYAAPVRVELLRGAA